MPESLYIQFTDNTYVATERGIERLVDILHRPVAPCLWAIKWTVEGKPNGISFHKSHGHARKFAELQIDSEPDGPARLVNVSDHIYNCVEEHEYCWTDLSSFDEARSYQGKTWTH